MSMREKIIGIALMWFLFLSCVSASHEDISFETDMGKKSVFFIRWEKKQGLGGRLEEDREYMAKICKPKFPSRHLLQMMVDSALSDKGRLRQGSSYLRSFLPRIMTATLAAPNGFFFIPTETIYQQSASFLWDDEKLTHEGGCLYPFMMTDEEKRNFYLNIPIAYDPALPLELPMISCWETNFIRKDSSFVLSLKNIEEIRCYNDLDGRLRWDKKYAEMLVAYGGNKEGNKGTIDLFYLNLSNCYIIKFENVACHFTKWGIESCPEMKLCGKSVRVSPTLSKEGKKALYWIHDLSPSSQKEELRVKPEILFFTDDLMNSQVRGKPLHLSL